MSHVGLPILLVILGRRQLFDPVLGLAARSENVEVLVIFGQEPQLVGALS